MQTTRLDISGAIATITFDRDDKRNAFSHAMSTEVLHHIDTAMAESARVLVLRANPGVAVWCAGHDLADLDIESDTTRSNDPMLALFSRIQEIPVPVITLVEGDVFAGGLILNVVADIAVAARDTRVSMTANRIGIPFTPEMYAYWLRVVNLHKLKELFFTAAPITADDAYIAGIFNHVVERDRLDETVSGIADRILECAGDSVADSKAQLNRIASRSSLTTEDLVAIEEARRRILDSPALAERLAALVKRLGNKAT